MIAPAAVTDLADDSGPVTPQERAALALWLLQQKPLTTRQLANRLGISRQGTERLLATISRVIPVYKDQGRWYICD